MCTARRFSSSVCVCVCLGHCVCVSVSCLRFVPLVYAHYVSAARGKLTNCCTRNDAGGATQVHSARKHTNTQTHTHTYKGILFLALPPRAFGIFEFNFQVNCKKFLLLVVIRGVYALFSLPISSHLHYRGSFSKYAIQKWKKAIGFYSRNYMNIIY